LIDNVQNKKGINPIISPNQKNLLNKKFFLKKIYGIWRTLTNYNLQGKSKKNVEHHYDV